jgi:hypothetical protein
MPWVDHRIRLQPHWCRGLGSTRRWFVRWMPVDDGLVMMLTHVNESCLGECPSLEPRDEQSCRRLERDQ